MYLQDSFSILLYVLVIHVLNLLAKTLTTPEQRYKAEYKIINCIKAQYFVTSIANWN